MRRDTSQLLLIVSDGRGIFLEGMEVSNTFDSSLYVNLLNLGLDSFYAGLSLAPEAAAEHHGQEILVIYASKKFWFLQNRLSVRTCVHSFM